MILVFNFTWIRDDGAGHSLRAGSRAVGARGGHSLVLGDVGEGGVPVPVAAAGPARREEVATAWPGPDHRSCRAGVYGKEGRRGVTGRE